MPVKVEIDVEPDRVIIEHQIIIRPDHIPRSEWMDFWEKVKWLGFGNAVQN